jgi:hypothetical protein
VRNEHKTRREISKIFVPNILSRLFTYKTKKKSEQDGRPAVATAAYQITPTLSTVFEISPVVDQLLRFNDGSLTAIRDDLLLSVSVCGKENYLHNITITQHHNITKSQYHNIST